MQHCLVKSLGFKLYVFWFWLEYKRFLKGNNSEYVYIFTSLGGLTSCWAIGVFYNFQKWYCQTSSLQYFNISFQRGFQSPFHPFENYVHWFSVEVDRVDILLEFHFLSDFLDITPSSYPSTSLKVSFLSWLAHFIYFRPYKSLSLKLQSCCFQTVVLEKTLESPLDSKEIKPVNPKGNQPWIFIGRTDAEVEAPILRPPDAKSWLTGKDPDPGKDWKQQEKRATEGEMVGWHHWLNGHQYEQTLGDSEGQGRLLCCSPWGHKETQLSDWRTKLLLTTLGEKVSSKIWMGSKEWNQNLNSGNMYLNWYNCLV